MTGAQIEYPLGDPSATEALGAALAHGYHGQGYGRAGGGGAVVFLQGELGAGKTTCVRALLRTLGVTGLIRSPTYTLVEVYELTMGSCVHVDLYRLQGLPDVEELGLRDYLGGDHLLLVEWPEKGAGALPRADLELTLSYWGGARRALVHARTERGDCMLRILRHDTRLNTYLSNLT
jgi:tRNA threonylcarbamoyladenosine biosynthesis protein TsaE